MPTAFAVFPHGVIGNTTVFGTVILGSSPGGEADFCSPLTGVFAGCGLFFFLCRVTLATFGDLRKRFSLRQRRILVVVETLPMFRLSLSVRPFSRLVFESPGFCGVGG